MQMLKIVLLVTDKWSRPVFHSQVFSNFPPHSQYLSLYVVAALVHISQCIYDLITNWPYLFVFVFSCHQYLLMIIIMLQQYNFRISIEHILVTIRIKTNYMAKHWLIGVTGARTNDTLSQIKHHSSVSNS